MFKSARRPLHASSAENMPVQMLNALLTVFTGVDNNSEALFGDARVQLQCFFTISCIYANVSGIAFKNIGKMLFGN